VQFKILLFKKMAQRGVTKIALSFACGGIHSTIWGLANEKKLL
jgi:hypothetical protein